MDLVLNNQQSLICHKTQTNQTNTKMSTQSISLGVMANKLS